MVMPLLLAAALALGLRGLQLGCRPMHNDEGVNALKFGQLWEGGGYKYDPQEHHGPSLEYATLAWGRLTGAPDFDHYSEVRLRLLTVLFGAGLVLLLPLVVDGLGRQGMLWAAFLTAVSPAMVFYSRYYIHEMLLVFFSFLAIGAGWRYWRSRKLGWALLAGLALGLMHATKETFVLVLLAGGLALGLNQVWNRLLDASGVPAKARPLKAGPLLAAAAVWLGVALLFFSSFFSNPAGLWDSLRTYQPWLSRAAGASPHIHPWHFYLQRLLWFHPANGPVWTEALILALAILGGLAGFRRVRLGAANASFVRFLAIYTFLLMAFYSLIAYKTPWCLLGFWHGAILLAGVGAVVVLRSVRSRPARRITFALLVLGTAHLGWQAWQEAGPYAADRRNPYVYAQTGPDALRLVAQVEALAQALPPGQALEIQVAAPEGDYGPLPWLLRRFKQTGWWSQTPPGKGQVLIVAAALGAGLDEKAGYRMVGYFDLRPQVPFELYVQPSLWQGYVERMPAQSKD